MIGAKDITCYCGYIGRGETMDERLVDKELHERTHKNLDPPDPDAEQAKDEAEMAMFVIIRKREGKSIADYRLQNSPSIIHQTFEAAREEAIRLVLKHIHESPRFEIYELVYRHGVEASIDVRET